MRGILKFFFFSFLAFITLYSPALYADEPQDRLIMRSVFADGRLWLLTDSGRLSSLTETSAARRQEGLSGKVLELCVTDGHATAFTRPSEKKREWEVQRWSSLGWRLLARVPAQYDDLVGVECRKNRITIAATSRLITLENGRLETKRIVGDAYIGDGVMTLSGTSEDLFLGMNKGEWGGSLYRIERRSGKVVPSSGNPSADNKSCGGPLSYACSPVTAIAELPWKSGCIAIARGLIHMGSAGGDILEVCGDDAKVLYSEYLYADDPKTPRDEDGNPFNTVPFFGLVRSDGQLMAASFENVYSIDKDGHTTVLAQPQFKDIDGVGVSFYRPDVVLVMTRINGRRSMSGEVPILVAR